MKQTWFRADIPKHELPFVRDHAHKTLGAQYELRWASGVTSKTGKQKFWTNKGKWMIKRGSVYFRDEAVARKFEQELTMHILKRTNAPRNLEYMLSVLGVMMQLFPSPIISSTFLSSLINEIDEEK